MEPSSQSREFNNTVCCGLLGVSEDCIIISILALCHQKTKPLTHNVIVAVAKTEELRARLLLQYTHEYEQYYEEQVNFFLFCYFYL